MSVPFIYNMKIFKILLSCLHFTLLSESPVELVARLHDICVPAKGTAVFECEVSLPGVKPQWYKDEEPITISDGYDIRTDGTHHYLYLEKVGLDDIGDYSVQFDDVECTATLQIEGSCRSIY